LLKTEDKATHTLTVIEHNADNSVNKTISTQYATDDKTVNLVKTYNTQGKITSISDPINHSDIVYSLGNDGSISGAKITQYDVDNQTIKFYKTLIVN